MSKIIVPDEKWVELYAMLSEYILEYASLDPIYDDEGNKTEEKQDEFIDIVNSVESIMESVLTKEGELSDNQDSIKELVGIINYALEDNTDAPVSIHDLAWQLVELTRPEGIKDEWSIQHIKRKNDW